MICHHLIRLLLILLVCFTWTIHTQQEDTTQLEKQGEKIEARETTYKSGDIEIAATLLMPSGKGRHPVAVLIQGAGESSRKNLWALQIGEHLASRGIAAFLPDKRGSGDSGGDWKKASFDDLASDIQEAVIFLSRLPEINADAIGVIGLSQGGFYAPIVANQSEAVAFVGAVSASAMPFSETINHEMSNTFREDGLTGVAHEQAMALQRSALQYARDGKWEVYEQVRTTTLQGPAASAAEGFPSSPDHWLWGWITKVVDFDPIDHWQHLSQPIFFAFGQTDEEDNVPVEKSVARIRSELATRYDVAVHVYPGSGHPLYDPVQAKEGRGIVRRDFADDLANWIKHQVESKGDQR